MPLHLPRLQCRIKERGAELGAGNWRFGARNVNGCLLAQRTCTSDGRTDGPEALVARLAVVVAGHARRPRAAHRGDGGARREAGAVARRVVEAEVPALAAQQAELLAPVCQG